MAGTLPSGGVPGFERVPLPNKAGGGGSVRDMLMVLPMPGPLPPLAANLDVDEEAALAVG